MRMATLEQIDALVSARKSFVGIPTWKPNPSKPERSELLVPLRCGLDFGLRLELRAHATLTAVQQRGGLVLIVEGQPVQRINILPHGPHTNPFRPEVPAELRGIRLPPQLTRIYLWADGRYLPAKTEVGKSISLDTTDFDAAVSYFLKITGIEGDIPSPPHTPRLFA